MQRRSFREVSLEASAAVSFWKVPWLGVEHAILGRHGVVLPNCITSAHDPPAHLGRFAELAGGYRFRYLFFRDEIYRLSFSLRTRQPYSSTQRVTQMENTTRHSFLKEVIRSPCAFERSQEEIFAANVWLNCRNRLSEVLLNIIGNDPTHPSGPPCTSSSGLAFDAPGLGHFSAYSQCIVAVALATARTLAM